MSALNNRKNDLNLLRAAGFLPAAGEAEIAEMQNTASDFDNLVQIHHEWELASLLWETIQDELLEFLRPESDDSDAFHLVHNQTRLENLYREEILAEIESETHIQDRELQYVRFSATEFPGRDPERRQGSLYYPSIRELRGLPPDKKKQHKEREHFLGRENTRRPSKN